MTHLQVVVRGLVQGVGYRDGVRRAAARHGISGWVRNRRDGSVEADLSGPEDAVAAVRTWMAHGPAGARVDDLTATPLEPAAVDGFRILATE